jgi:DNA-binding MarR family transcriptional regulator
MEGRTLQVRKYLSIIQVVANNAMGISLGRRSDISLAGSYILYRSNFFKMNMKDIRVANSVSKSTVTQYIDMLENKGYVQRVKGEEDKRDIFVVPTEKGKAWIADTEKKMLDYVGDGMSRLTPDEQDTFVELFSKFIGETKAMPFEKIIASLREDR